MNQDQTPLIEAVRSGSTLVDQETSKTFQQTTFVVIGAFMVKAFMLSPGFVGIFLCDISCCIIWQSSRRKRECVCVCVCVCVCERERERERERDGGTD